MFCTKCGKELLDGSKFCSNCGEPIGSVEPMQSSSVSREHIQFDWQGMDSTPVRREEKKAVFDWGLDNTVTNRRPATSGRMFQDKELVRRATQELDLGDVRKRAQELREDYSKIKEEKEEKEDAGLSGIEVAVDEMSKAGFKSIKELEDELFDSYVEEPVIEKPKKEEIIEEKNIAEEIVEEDEELEEESNVDSIPIQYTATDIVGEKSFKEIKKQEEMYSLERGRVYTEAEREDIDEYLEKTLIYSLGDFEKRLEEARERKAEREGLKKANANAHSIENNVEAIIEKEAPKEEVLEELPNEIVEEKEEELNEISEVIEETIDEELIDVEVKEETLEEVKEEIILNETEEVSGTIEESITTPIKEETLEEVKEEIILNETEEVSSTIEEPITTPIKEEIILPEIEDYKEEIEETERLDEKFLTFNQKSAEFNALLEREKEKLNLEKKEEALDFSTLDEYIDNNFVKKEEPINENEPLIVKEEVEAEVEEIPSEIKKQFEEVLNEPVEEKKKRGLFSKKDDYTQSVAVLEEIAKALDEQRNDDTFTTLNTNSEPVVNWDNEIPKKEEKVTRMTITGLDLEKTYDFNDDKELGKVPRDVVNEELDGGKVEELKSTLDDFYKENPKPQKKHVFAKVLIAILIILVLFEGAIVACKYLAPDSRFIALVDYYTAKILALIGQ